MGRRSGPPTHGKAALPIDVPLSQADRPSQTLLLHERTGDDRLAGSEIKMCLSTCPFALREIKDYGSPFQKQKAVGARSAAGERDADGVHRYARVGTGA